jgi:O-acetyl-ADP-ribose deacetylase
MKAVVGNLLENIKTYNLDGVMNAANGIGPMGRGIAGAIKRTGGQMIQDDAFRVCRLLDPKAGEAYSTISGKLLDQGVKRIIHAVSMKSPAGLTSYSIIRSAFENAIALADKEKIKILGCTALGTGVGELNPVIVADEMYSVAKSATIQIVFIDFDEEFISRINYLISDNEE